MDYRSNDSLIIGGGEKRDGSLDTLKFILIFFVALCHSLEPFRYSHYSVAAFYSVVYSFHMPMFVMLSGYFSKHLTFDKLKHGVPKLLETYIVMCLVSMIFVYNKNELKAPMLSEWYVLSLVFWRICVTVVNYLRLKKTLVISLSFLGAFSAFILLGDHSYILSSMRTMSFLPYFFIGFFMTPKDVLSICDHRKAIACITFIFLVLLIVTSFYFPRLIHVMEYNCYSLPTFVGVFDLSLVEAFIVKIMFYIIGIILCFYILQFRVNNNRIAKYGRYTLFFYCLQMYFIQIPERQGLFSNIWLSIISTIFVMLISCILTRYKNIMAFVTNPITTCVGKISFEANKK